MAISRAWYAQKNFLRKTHNKNVNAYFKDVPEVDDNLGIGTTRREAKSACLIRPKDSQNMALLKVITFYNVVQKVQFSPQFFGLPIQTFIDTQRNKPQIIVHFQEKKTDAANNDRIPARSQVAFRLEEQSWTEAKIDNWAQKVKTAFAVPRFSYKKGTLLFTYTDKQDGWIFQLYTQSELEAKSVIEKCFQARSAGTPDYTTFLTQHQDNKNYSSPEFVSVLGESRRKPRRRPVATVWFAYAELLIPGLPDTITLVDVTGQRRNPRIVV